jgi:hypothetical protein
VVTKLPLPPRPTVGAPNGPAVFAEPTLAFDLQDAAGHRAEPGPAARPDERTTSPDAVKAAVGLARDPRLIAQYRREPLPAGIPRLIRVAARVEGRPDGATQLSGVDPTYLHAAAIFFLEEVLWFDGADPSRVLGFAPGASPDEVARNVRLLMQWLHPYIGSGHREGAFAERVIAAWELHRTRDLPPTVSNAEDASALQHIFDANSASIDDDDSGIQLRLVSQRHDLLHAISTGLTRAWAATFGRRTQSPRRRSLPPKRNRVGEGSSFSDSSNARS